MPQSPEMVLSDGPQTTHLTPMSFRRRTSAASTPGVTRTASGARVVSSGIRGLDELLGGGVALGTLTVIVEDGISALHAQILASFARDAQVHAHPLAIALPTATANDFISVIDSTTTTTISSIVPTDQAPKLNIAWRYAQNSSTPRSSSSSSSIQSQARTDTPITRLGFPDVRIDTLLSGIREHCKRPGVKRVIIGTLGSLWHWNTIVIHQLLAALRISDTAVLITVPCNTNISDLSLTADAVLVMSALPSSSTPKAPSGVAVLHKAPHIAPGRWLGVRGSTYVYRATRRGIAFDRAAIEPQHDDDVAQGCATSSPAGIEF